MRTDRVAEAEDGGLRALAEAMISVGPHLAFLWRKPDLRPLRGHRPAVER